MLRLRWPDNPKTIRQGELLELSLLLENTGSDSVEFADAHLVLFGRLLDEDGNELATNGHRLARELPLIHYRLDPGDQDTVSVGLTLSPEDQRSLSAGRYTVVLPLGDRRDEFANSVLISSGAKPPSSLAVVVQPTTTGS